MTIADPDQGVEAGREFASRFFGVDAATVELVGEKYEPDRWASKRTVSGALPGSAAVHLENVLDAVMKGERP